MSEDTPYVGLAVLAVVTLMFGLGLSGGYYTYGSLSDAERGQALIGAATNFPTTSSPTTTTATNTPTTATTTPTSNAGTTATTESGNVACSGNTGCDGDTASLVGVGWFPEASSARRG